MNRAYGPMIAIHLDAGHDTNGNPRRGFLVLSVDDDWARFVEYVNEGYEGKSAVTRRYPGIAIFDRVPTSASFLRSLRRGPP